MQSVQRCKTRRKCACGRVLKDDGVGVTCAKCSNHSFSHLAHDLHDDITSSVPCIDTVSEKPCEVEVVPLNQFVRAGKRHMYEYCGVIAL